MCQLMYVKTSTTQWHAQMSIFMLIHSSGHRKFQRTRQVSVRAGRTPGFLRGLQSALHVSQPEDQADDTGTTCSM